MQTKATTPLSAAAQPQSREAEGAEWLLDIGSNVSLDSLPPPETKRWVIRRKAEVVAAVRAGLLSLEEACARYTLSVEEFLSWQRLVDSHGLPGLRVTRLQDYRALDKNERLFQRPLRAAEQQGGMICRPPGKICRLLNPLFT